MSTRRSIWLGILAISSSLSLSSAASAQQVDWPTLKGNNARVGYNQDAGPGQANPIWWTPASADNRYTTPYIVDNTDANPNPYAVNPAGTFYVGTVNNPNSSPPTLTPGTVPLPANFNATNPWQPDPLATGSQTNVDAADPWIEFDPNNGGDQRQPSYIVAAANAQQNGGSLTPKGALTASWVITPTYNTANPAGQPQPNLYGLYVWIPTGPQLNNGQETFPQEFYVYTVTCIVNGQPQVFTDVVDTYLSGGGWVRLGNGGQPTNMVFPYDGTDAFTITLYNTIPLDPNGNPTSPAGTVVYADAAMAAPCNGYYDASPVSSTLAPGTPQSTVTIGALNQFSSTAGSGGSMSTLTTGVATAYTYNTGQPIWTYTPQEASATPATMDVTAANLTAGWAADTNPPAAGASPAYTTLINNTVQTATYTPPGLSSGSYFVYVFLPGNNTNATTGVAETYGASLTYNVTSGVTGAIGVTPVVVDQSQARGWYQLPGGPYTNVANAGGGAGTLSVQLTTANDTTDPGLGRLAYADEIRFVGANNQAISSTPTVALNVPINVGGTIVNKNVAIVCDENGYIHCIDANGSGNGTTTEYWSYPTSPNFVGTDPNVGTPIMPGPDAGATMPSGFSLSSALIASPDGVNNYLYIYSTNGYVYCIDMLGRGDQANGAPGTTWREWTYPNTAPASPSTNNLGQARGSVSSNIITGQPLPAHPTIYVPAMQGRIYALDATGNQLADPGTGTRTGNGTTTVDWAFPALNQPTLGGIWTTPVYEFGNLYFGTQVNANTDANGIFYCVDATNYSAGTKTTGVKWFYNGGNAIPWGNLGQSTYVNTSDFLSSPAVVPFSTIYPAGAVPAGVTSTSYNNDGLVYVMNQNTFLYAFEAVPNNGGNPVVEWNPDNELNVGAIGGIGFTLMSVYNNGGAIAANTPVATVPTQDGRYDAMFADPTVTDQFGGRQAWEWQTLGYGLGFGGTELASTMAMSNGWMYGTDESGVLTAFNNATGSLSPGNPPGSSTITANNPAGNIFRNAQLMLLTQAGYDILRQPTGQNLDYYTATKQTNNPYAFTRSPLAFEWGESAYIMVYNFPYQILNTSGNPAAPPIINVTFSSQGRSVTRSAEARLYTEPPNAPDDMSDPNYPNGTERDNGYAVLQIQLGYGQLGLPPGPGSISFSIASSAFNSYGANQTIAANPNTSNLPYYIANPLALSTDNPSVGNNPYNTQPPSSADIDSIGFSTSPSDPENLVNGSPLIPGDADNMNKITNLIGTSAGLAQHGSSVTAPVYIWDRSMMAALSPEGIGLPNVAADVRNLSWEGGSAAIYHPLNPNYYINFEDYPNNYPNNSIDYPDIQSTQIQIVSNPQGAAQNPEFSTGANLNPPMIKDPNTGALRAMQLGDNPAWRVFQPTQWNVTVNVPLYQPANSNAQLPVGVPVTDSSGTVMANQGYLGRLRAYVTGNPPQSLGANSNLPYRGMNLAAAVAVDQRITVSTPTVALGDLPEGTGYNPLMPGSGPGTQGYSNANQQGGANLSTIFEPWNGGFGSSLFQSFIVNNPGNVNLVNLRLAKASAITGTVLPWEIYASGNDSLGFLDGSIDSWSDIDSTFAPMETGIGGNWNQVALQKPRVVDATPTQLTANAVQRANPNLGTTGTFLPPGSAYPPSSPPDTVLNETLGADGLLLYKPVAPRVAVSVPLGMPVGTYSQVMRIIEKSDQDQTWEMFNGVPEAYSDPTFTLTFTVRESQLTNSYSPNTAPMTGNLTPPGPANPFAYSNLQPAMVRDPYGSLIVAWASDMPSWNPATPTTQEQLGYFGPSMSGSLPPGGGLYIATVGNSATFGSNSVTGDVDPLLPPLGDLNNFTPASTAQWFNQAVAAYPQQSPNLLFNVQNGETIVPGTVAYGSPSFPQAGLTNPLNPAGSPFRAMYMGFVGQAQKQTSSGRLGESFIMMTQIQPAQGGNIGTPGQPVTMANDPLVTKGRPSIVQTTQGACVFYPGEAGGRSNAYFSRFNGNAFGPSISLPFPGFQSVSSVSAGARVYSGVGSFKTDGVTPILKPGDDVVELTFSGQMNGRPNPEVFLGRMKLDPNALVPVDDQGIDIDNTASDGNAFLVLSQQVGETLVAGSQPGLYRALGVMWDPTSTIQIAQTLNGITTSLLVAGTGNYDRETGIIAYDSSLGGKVYIDAALGTVRFATGIPNLSALVQATYSPRFLRISASGGSGYARPTGLFDHRQISTSAYWYYSNGNSVGASDNVPYDRYQFTYNRASGGAGTPPRPYMTSIRYGVQLPFRIATDNNGNPLGVQITGQTRAVGAFQVDPANARIYFTGADEDNVVAITYTALSESGGQSTYTLPYQPTVGLIREASEQPILIETAVNESDMTSFLDPFTYTNAASRRPPLTWLFWTSARGGSPNIFFETISPQWASIPVSQ